MGYRSYFSGGMQLDTTGYTGTLDDLKQVILDSGADQWDGYVSVDLDYERVWVDQQFARDADGQILRDQNQVAVDFDGQDTCLHDDLNDKLVKIAAAVQSLDGVRVTDVYGTRDGDEDEDFEQFAWINGTVHSSQQGLLTEKPIDQDAPIESLVDSEGVTMFLERQGAPTAMLALVEVGKRLGDTQDSGVFTESELTALATPLRPVADPGSDRSPDALARHAAARVLDRIPDAPRSGDALVDLGFELGESITYEDGMTALVTAALWAAEDSKQFVVMGAVGGGDPEGIMGRYRTRREADAVAEAWNRCNGEVATYTVVDEGEYDENGNEVGGSPDA